VETEQSGDPFPRRLAMNPLARARALALALALALSAVGCRSTGAFLLFGSSGTPQDALIAKVHSAEDEAKAAERDFATAFHLYQRLTTPQAVELEDLSDEFEDAIDECKDRAHELDERIESVHSESEALFKGWSEELTQFSGDVLRKKSETMMQDTQVRAQKVSAALERVQKRMEPVLKKLQDYALFFHHNLNARAIATLEDTYKDFDGEFSALNAELAKARTELAAFLAAFVASEPPPKNDAKK
jgi:chromosome segregation ATPase